MNITQQLASSAQSVLAGSDTFSQASTPCCNSGHCTKAIGSVFAEGPSTHLGALQSKGNGIGGRY